MRKHATLKKPRLLFLSSRLPYPPIAGIRLKNYHLIRELFQSFDLTILSLGTEPLSSEGRDYIEQYGKLSYWRKTRKDFMVSAAAAPFHFPAPFQAGLYYFKDIGRTIRSLAPEHDAIFCNLIRTTMYAEELSLPKFCDMADSISDHYASLLNGQHMSVMYPYYLIDQPLIRRYEQHIIRTFDQCFMFNSEEIDRYDDRSKLTWVPHGVNPDLLSERQADRSFENGLVFFGKMDYAPNVAAARWFAERVMPILPRELSFIIIGANPSRAIRALENDRIKVLGFVPDPYPTLRGALAVVAPMQFGGGVQNKILEAMAVSGLCIATSAPVRALRGVQDGRELLVADTPEEYATIIQKVLLNPRDYLTVRQSARKFIEQNHSWSRAGEIYKQSILKGLGSN